MRFELLSEELIFHGKIFDLVKSRFRLFGGSEMTYDLVKHRGAVVIIPVDAQQNILFVRQFRIGAERALLELPAGLLEQGESPETCAAREIQEEIGVASRDLVRLGEFFMVPGYSTEKMHLFLATGLFESRITGDADEFIERVSIPVEKAYHMAHTGEILDGKTLAGLFLALPWLNPDHRLQE